ncbi:MAG TPA: RNA methyltransferase [Dermatophilaceae bacterium]|nr:RNA methyltransferase [Dermatophilaceae bacterium]
MLANPRAERVRSVRALARRSSRDRAGLFVAEGPQSVREALAHAPDRVADVYAEPATPHTALLDAARAAGVPVHLASAEVIAAMADTGTPQGVLAVCRVAHPALPDLLAAGPRLLVLLAHVRDPGNAGTVIRGADAAGADAVLVSDASVDVHNPKAVRATAGSLFHLPVVTALPVQPTLRQLRSAGLALYAADGSGAAVLGEPGLDLAGPHAWVMGNEAWGLTPAVRQACDRVVRVPIHGKAESLNLAMAATVCLYAAATAQRAQRG